MVLNASYVTAWVGLLGAPVAALKLYRWIGLRASLNRKLLLGIAGLWLTVMVAVCLHITIVRVAFNWGVGVLLYLGYTYAVWQLMDRPRWKRLYYLGLMPVVIGYLLAGSLFGLAKVIALVEPGQVVFTDSNHVLRFYAIQTDQCRVDVLTKMPRLSFLARSVHSETVVSPVDPERPFDVELTEQDERLRLRLSLPGDSAAVATFFLPPAG